VSVAGRRLPLPCLLLVTDRTLTGGEDGLIAAVDAAVEGGVNAVELREKELANEALAALCGRLVAAVGARALVLLNGAPAVALAAGAAGVHLGEAALPVGAARRAVRDRLLVGRSVHGLPAAVEAERGGADYLVLGTIFPSRSHPGGETGGAERVREVAAAVRIPVLAIGGITVEHVPEVIEAGAAGIAVISAILAAPDPREAAARLRRALDAAWDARPAAVGAGVTSDTSRRGPWLPGPEPLHQAGQGQPSETS
jgi:thiamine-phosphate pyrophosphorylase